ncbi:MAG: DAK2 domain-containing protein [Actinobacteria bacterium]|nr:DAK2 domain-containing protein [Actinomycetota bacterium]
MLDKINNQDVKKVIDVIISNFKEEEAKINNLNVFPVPDGDTGTNMLLTLKAIQQELNNMDNFSFKNIAEKVSYGALMGARGNSGVILSQILKGFFDIITPIKELDIKTIREALKSSMRLAYDSVQNPTEGTMLTTIKDIYQSVENINDNNVTYDKLLDIIIEETEKSVLRTTFLLPVLKQAGVVDAGAQGILEILIGFKKAVFSNNYRNSSGKKYAEINKNSDGKITDEVKEGKKDTEKVAASVSDNSDEASKLKKLDLISGIKNIYCTEVMVRGEGINVVRLREYIENLGDSALIVGNEKLVKIHVHTNYPHKVLRRALREGTIHDIQINNMIDQSREAIAADVIEEIKVIKKEYGLVSIVNGDGFEEIFKSIGTDVIVKGGQSMNPSTYDIVKAINKLDCNRIIILPNNKNIILTANQAKKIVKKDITVIPTTAIPQGISAALIFNPDLNIEENIDNIQKAIESIKTGEITTAVRNANLFVGQIKKGEYIGLANSRVKIVSDNLIDAVIDLVRDLITGNEEVITFYYGEGIQAEQNKNIEDRLKELYPKIEIEFHRGGQPLYPYIFSIE